MGDRKVATWCIIDDRLRVGSRGTPPREVPRVCGTSTHEPGRVTTRAEDAKGKLTQSHASPSILVYEDY